MRDDVIALLVSVITFLHGIEMKKFLLSMVLVVGVAGQAVADVVSTTATLTADDHYGLFVGDAAGGDLRFIGRNETGFTGAPGSFPWSLPETFHFETHAGDYLYVLAWDDGGPQGLIGNFLTPSGVLSTNKTDWLAKTVTSGNPGSSGAVPGLSTVSALIASGGWGAVSAQVANGSGVWGSVSGAPIPGVGSASWIWQDTLDTTSLSDSGFVLFRSASAIMAAAEVPEPMTLSMLIAGLGLLGFAKRRV